MYKLKERFDFDLYQKFTYYSLYSNALFLNKKLNLLYNFWNKQKIFLLLKDNKNFNRLNNFQSFYSLEFNLELELKKKEKADYFHK